MDEMMKSGMPYMYETVCVIMGYAKLYLPVLLGMISLPQPLRLQLPKN